MKIIGIGREIKILRVTAGLEVFSNLDFMCDIGRGPVVRPPRVTVKIEFLFIVNDIRSHAYTINMNGYNRDGRWDEQLRDELKQSHYWDYDIWSNGHQAAFERDGWTLQIIDPAGVLEWFGLDAAADLFKQQNQINDQPVRLPAPGVE